MARNRLSPQQRQRVDDILAEIIHHDPMRHDALVQEHCADDEAVRAEVQSLLAAAARDSDSLWEVARHLPTIDACAHQVNPAASVIGPYQVLETLGEGGFGIVYLAEQREPIRRRVALKVIKPGMDSRQVIARFRAEEQALALMNHPCVAKVLDAGATDDGRLYFVMEHVPGAPITEHCDQHRLTIEERLELFTQVCEAVQHAHQKGVIHRDLKPSNVLVESTDKGAAPKVIDFGIAKALSQPLTEDSIFTEQGQIIGTPEYMAPEQAVGGAQDIDSRADVYSLGVLLYELLTGCRPFSLRQAALLEIQRQILEADPPKPSTRLMTAGADTSEFAKKRGLDPKSMQRKLRGDLDWIVIKCLEKDRARRYDSASGLAADVRRHLANEPVLAGPPSTSYRVGKFVRRNRTLVTAAAIILIVLLGGIAGTTWGMVSASAARANAEAHATELEQVARFQAEQIGRIDPQMMAGLLRRLILADAANGASAITDSLSTVGFTDIARETLREIYFVRTIDAIDEQFRDQPSIQAQLLQSTATAMSRLGLFYAAEAPQRRALELRRTHLSQDDPRTLESVSALANLLAQQGRMSEAGDLWRQTLSARRRTLGDHHPATIESMNDVATVLYFSGNLESALEQFTLAREIYRRSLADEPSETLITIISNIGSVLDNLERLDDAEAAYREAWTKSNDTFGPDADSTLVSLNNLAYINERQGRLADAAPQYQTVLERRRRVLGDAHPKTVLSIMNLASLQDKIGHHGDAEALLREGLGAARRELGESNADTITMLERLAACLLAQDKLDEAEILVREAADRSERELGPDHLYTLDSRARLASLLHRRGQTDEAEQLYRHVVEVRRAAAIDGDPKISDWIAQLGAVLRDSGKLGEADSLGAEAVQSARAAFPAGHYRIGKALREHARTLAELGRFGEAATLGLEACEIASATFGPTDAQTAAATSQLVDLYRRWHDVDPGAGHDATAAEWESRLGADTPP